VYNKKLLSRFAMAVIAVFFCLAAQATLASTVVVGTCRPGMASYSTIQSAVNAVPSGSTIGVCPGYYPEQVTINGKTLTVIGIQFGTRYAAVIIPPPGGLVSNTTDIDGELTAAQIFVENATGVIISHLTVDGSGNKLADCTKNPIGIYFKNSSGKITADVTRNQSLGGTNQGCQAGLGIDVESNTGTPAVTISNNSVHNYQKNGITASGPGTGEGPAVYITANTVTGIGPTPNIAQNGIQISFGASGKATANHVADNIYTGANSGATGILIYASTGVLVSNNSVESTQFGIATVTDSTLGSADNATINSNHIGGTQTFDAIDLCSNGNTAQSNAIYGNNAESGVHLDDRCPAGSTPSGHNNTVKNNTINEPCAGILLGAGTPNTVGPNTFFNVSFTTLAGNSCTPPSASFTAAGAASSTIRESRRPLPFKP
jgi:hypothetical protein